MMDSWRRQPRSQNRKPPIGNWQPTVPSWEKKFCTVVGSVPWRKIVETKKCIHLYDNVLKWNDSAGEEAFHNAKNRFWAEINGFPCDISLPNPDIHIDKIDWNSNIDPELLLDLEREFVVPDDQEKREQVVIIGEPLVPSESFSPAGWGDAEVDVKKATNSTLQNKGSPWELNCAQDNEPIQATGWGEIWNNPREWNHWEGNNYGSDNSRFHGRHNMSRYKTSRFHGDDNLANREWRNGNGKKRANFVHEQSFTDKRPASRQWNVMNACGPISHHGSSKPGDQWSWEKSVS
ncbi:unnamed protein product [Camellia sinensis]